MIVADTNVWIAYLEGDTGSDVSSLDEALATETFRMAAMVLSGLLSVDTLAPAHERILVHLPMLSLSADYWIRVGKLRAALYTQHYRPRLVDAMIAQICMDHQATLLSRDVGFRCFVDAGL